MAGAGGRWVTCWLRRRRRMLLVRCIYLFCTLCWAFFFLPSLNIFFLGGGAYFRLSIAHCSTDHNWLWVVCLYLICGNCFILRLQRSVAAVSDVVNVVCACSLFVSASQSPAAKHGFMSQVNEVQSGERRASLSLSHRTRARVLRPISDRPFCSVVFKTHFHEIRI